MSNNAEVCVMWAGGYDDYIIDLSTTREETPEEKAAEQARIDKGFGGMPEVGQREWLRTRSICPRDKKVLENTGILDHELVRIIRHIRGGD